MFGRLGRRNDAAANIVAFLVSWLIFAAALWVADELLDGIFLQGLRSTLIVAFIFAVLNYLARYFISVGVLSLLTLGLFTVVLNMLLLLLTDWIVQEQDEVTIYFAVEDWVDALLGGLIIAVVSLLIGIFVNPHRVGRSIIR